MKPDRFLALDAWRGVCALIVAFGHLHVDNPLVDNDFVRHSYRFVDFFFVLSGFVIAHAYGDRLGTTDQVHRFLVRRAGRLWPLHLTMLLAFVLFEVAILVASRMGIATGREAFTEANTLGAIPANVVLIHAWGVFDHATWNNPSWSISTEWFAYGLFALMCRPLASRGTWRAPAAALLAAAAIIGVLAAPLGMKSTYDYGLFRCVFGFMTGVLVRSAWRAYAARIGTAGEIAMLGAVVAAVTWLPEGAGALAITPLFAVVVWAFASESGAVSRFGQRLALQSLGAWSYSIYMVHAFLVVVLLTLAFVAQKVGFTLFARVEGVPVITGGLVVTTLVLIGYITVVLGVARMTYRWVELPGQRLFRRFER